MIALRNIFYAVALGALSATACSDGVESRAEPVRVAATPDAGAPDPNEEEPIGEEPDGGCTPVAEGGALTGPLPIAVSGSVVGKENDYTTGPELCRESETNTSEDVAYTFTPDASGTYRFTSWVPGLGTIPQGIVLTIARPTCDTTFIACQAYDVPPGVDVPLTAGETVLVIIDPALPIHTDYTLTIEKK